MHRAVPVWQQVMDEMIDHRSLWLMLVVVQLNAGANISWCWLLHALNSLFMHLCQSVASINRGLMPYFCSVSFTYARPDCRVSSYWMASWSPTKLLPKTSRWNNWNFRSHEYATIRYWSNKIGICYKWSNQKPRNFSMKTRKNFKKYFRLNTSSYAKYAKIYKDKMSEIFISGKY